MPKGQPTPDYKFRLLCKRCNSYLSTCIDFDFDCEGYELRCEACEQTARDLDEERSETF